MIVVKQTSVLKNDFRVFLRTFFRSKALDSAPFKKHPNKKGITLHNFKFFNMRTIACQGKKNLMLIQHTSTVSTHPPLLCLFSNPRHSHVRPNAPYQQELL